MFILKKEATFTQPIKFYTPSDGGIQKEETFDAIFKIIPQSRINEIREQADKKQKELDQGITDGENISDVLIADEILVGWDGITDGEKEIPYSKATKKLILEYPLLANTLVEIYFAELTKQKAKN
tara:strand:+ start:627 stop:1001 length:375 start_codon:yes stop_codon:yes gene_type:complete